jgi:PHD/YefM family antitoxin component YafN of YafNO toxin-antitoxin module
MNTAQIQYVSNENGKPMAVIVPIELWQQILAEQETAYLLKSEAMKQRLLTAKGRKEGIEFGEACEKLGI